MTIGAISGISWSSVYRSAQAAGDYVEEAVTDLLDAVSGVFQVDNGATGCTLVAGALRPDAQVDAGTDADTPDAHPDAPDSDIPHDVGPDATDGGDSDDGGVDAEDGGDGDIFDGDVIDGDVIDGDVIDGDVVDGDVVDGDVVDGEVDGGPNACATRPGVATLERPVNFATGVEARPTLDWSDCVDLDLGDSVSYVVEMADNAEFTGSTMFPPVTGSTMRVPDPIPDRATRYWRVWTWDTCPQSVVSGVFQFTTGPLCLTTPESYSLILPARDAVDVAVRPRFDWGDAVDRVSGPVTYTLQIDTTDTFAAPREISVGTASEYTLGEGDAALANSTRYYWRIIARNSCGNIQYSTEVFSFTTALLCTPHPDTDDTFTTGTLNNARVDAGRVTLAEDASAWTYRYEGDALPTAVGWTESDPLAWIAPTPEIIGGTLHVNTIDSDSTGYFSIPPSIRNSIGWIVEGRLRVVDNSQSNPTSSGCVIEVRDGVRYFMLRLLNNRILNFETSLDYPMDTRLGFHTYRIVGRNDDFFVYVDGVLRLNGTDRWLTESGDNLVIFNDRTTTSDSESFWDYVYYYNGGTTLPFVRSGSYTLAMIDAGAVNNIGSGASVSWGETLPAGTDISLSVYASATTTLPGTPCASGLTNDAGSIIPADCSGRYVWLEANLFSNPGRNATPTLSRVTLDHESCL